MGITLERWYSRKKTVKKRRRVPRGGKGKREEKKKGIVRGHPPKDERSAGARMAMGGYSNVKSKEEGVGGEVKTQSR